MTKRNFQQYLAYLMTGAIYYLLPALLIRDTGSGMIVLLSVIPFSVFIVSLNYAERNGFQWIFSLMTGLLWLPNIYWLNSTAAVYALIYGSISFAGQFFGFLLRKKN